MSSYNTSREPMLMDEFIALAESNGWSLATTDPKQPRDEVNLVDAAGGMIVAYPQPTVLDPHIGFRGGVYGLVEIWQEGSVEQHVLEGQEVDDEVTSAEELGALAEILKHYEDRPMPADTIREMLTDIGSRF